jgi:hypothetical protein
MERGRKVQGEASTRPTSLLPVIPLKNFLFRNPQNYNGLFSDGKYYVGYSEDWTKLNLQTPMK